MITNKTIAEQLAVIEQESLREDIALWGDVQGGFDNKQSDLINSSIFKEIISVLRENPLLVAPTLQWLKIKRAAMSRAQLHVLYTPEELAEMMKSVQ